MYACSDKHHDLVETLLKFKPDLDLKNKLYWDWTALHMSIMQDDVKLVKMLLKAGADKEQRDSVGRKAIQIADEHYKEETKKLLK